MTFTAYPLADAAFDGAFIGLALFLLLAVLTLTPWSRFVSGTAEPLASRHKAEIEAAFSAHLEEPLIDARIDELNRIEEAISHPEALAAREQFIRTSRRLIPVEMFNRMSPEPREPGNACHGQTVMRYDQL